MNKILNLENALKALGVETELMVDYIALCSDGKLHKAIELSTNIWGGEDNVSFVFHPITHELVDSYLDCPTVKKLPK